MDGSGSPKTRTRVRLPRFDWRSPVVAPLAAHIARLGIAVLALVLADHDVVEVAFDKQACCAWQVWIRRRGDGEPDRPGVERIHRPIYHRSIACSSPSARRLRLDTADLGHSWQPHRRPTPHELQARTRQTVKPGPAASFSTGPALSRRSTPRCRSTRGARGEFGSSSRNWWRSASSRSRRSFSAARFCSRFSRFAGGGVSGCSPGRSSRRSPRCAASPG